MPDQSGSKDAVRSRGLGASRPNAGSGAFAAAGAVAVLLWSIYLLRAIFHFDVIAFLHNESDDLYHRENVDRTTLYLILAIVGTLIAAIWAFAKSRKISELVRNGVTTTGTVVEKSMLKHHGMVPTTITYTVDGKTYQFRKDMLDGQYNVGDTVEIMYDPARPTHREVI